jgi:two-component system, cell cycle sensor histidine kinase and response regulator CckA
MSDQTPASTPPIVLVVEDESQVRMVLKVLLQNQGCQVLDADCAENALALWKTEFERISLLITDIIMPGQMSGWGLAEVCRNTRPHLPVIFTSGYSAEMDRMQSTLLHNAVFLEKPFNPEMFIAAFRTALRF